MRRLVILGLLAALTLTLAGAVLAAGTPAPPPAGLLPPTAPAADFNGPMQSSSRIVAALHMRGPEKILAAAVALLLLVALVMFAVMLRQVYGAPAREAAPRR
jgi:hypothetical protein